MSNNETRSRTGAPSVQQDAEPSVEKLFKALANPQRRFLLTYLRQEESVPVETVARQLAAWETEQTVADVSDDVHRRVESMLYHVHLPKLSSAGIVEHDAESDTVALGDAADAAEQYLEIAQRA